MGTTSARPVVREPRTSGIREGPAPLLLLTYGDWGPPWGPPPPQNAASPSGASGGSARFLKLPGDLVRRVAAYVFAAPPQASCRFSLGLPSDPCPRRQLLDGARRACALVVAWPEAKLRAELRDDLDAQERARFPSEFTVREAETWLRGHGYGRATLATPHAAGRRLCSIMTNHLTYCTDLTGEIQEEFAFVRPHHNLTEEVRHLVAFGAVPDFQEPTYGQTPLQLATRLIAFDLPQATDILVDLVSAAPNCNLVTWEAVPGQALILKLTGIFIGSPLDSAIGMYEKLEYRSSRSVLPLKIQQSELFLTCATCFPAIGARVPRHGFSAVLADHRDKLNLMIQFSFSDEAEMWMDLKDQVDCVDRFLNNALLAQTFIENNPSLDVTQPTLHRDRRGSVLLERGGPRHRRDALTIHVVAAASARPVPAGTRG